MTGRSMKLSVIIPCLNSAETISDQLEALASQHWSEPWEVIIADNGSTDGTIAIAEQYRSRLSNLRIVDASAFQGTSYAINAGVRAAAAESIAFCDADDEIAPGWVAAIGDALSSYDFVASRFDFQKLNEPWVIEARPCGQQHGLQRLWYPPYLPFAGGCGIGTKKAIHDAVGGYDETLTYVHDTDYCVKIQMTGVKLHFVSDALIHIRCRDTFKNIFSQARSWAEYNIVLYKRYQMLTNIKNEGAWRRYAFGWKQLSLLFLKWTATLILTPLYMTGRQDLLLRLPRKRSKGDIGRIIWQLGWHIGLLEGSIKHRTAPV
jgi:glycosyltransferase involved in cell wall biosynthesis